MQQPAELISIYSTTDYRTYLGHRMGRAGQRTGLRAKAAQAIGCHTTYLSLIMNGHAELSPEQAEALNEFLGHTESEAEFFHLLVSHSRAGTRPLKARFKMQIDRIIRSRSEVSARLGEKPEISSQDRERFYSSWIHGALHVLCTIPELQTLEALSRYLELPRKRLATALEFLCDIGVLREISGRYEPGATHIHLGGENPSIIAHHTQWRLHAIQSLQRRQREDIHYSAVVTLSKRDAVRVREILLSSLKEAISVVEPSASEEAHVLAMDWYPLMENASSTPP